MTLINLLKLKLFKAVLNLIEINQIFPINLRISIRILINRLIKIHFLNWIIINIINKKKCLSNKNTIIKILKTLLIKNLQAVK